MADIPSIKTPCVKVCAVDGRRGVCLGCGRTLAEIGGWAAMTDTQREVILAELPARMAALEAEEPAS